VLPLSITPTVLLFAGAGKIHDERFARAALSGRFVYCGLLPGRFGSISGVFLRYLRLRAGFGFGRTAAGGKGKRQDRREDEQ
jgi:hypothetical protein